MVLEIFLESDALGDTKDTKKVLVERWVFRHDAEVSAGPGPVGPDAQSGPSRPSVSAAYKQLVVFFRTLHAELRTLPAHRYARRAAERLTEDGAETVRVAFAVSGGSREDGEREEAFSKPPPFRRARRSPRSEPGGGDSSGRTTPSETSLGMSGVSSSGMVSSVSSSHASSSEGLGSSDGAAPKRSRSAPLSEEKNATSYAYRAYAFAAATAPGGGRLDASVFFLDADALAALRIGDAPFVGKKAKGAYRDEIGGDAYAAADAYAYASRASAAAEKEAEKEKARPRSAGSWKARATQFLATSPGSAKELRFAPFFFRPEADDVDTPPPPSRVGIALATSAAGGPAANVGARRADSSRPGLLSAEMARFEPDARIGSSVDGTGTGKLVGVPSSFVNGSHSPFHGTPASGASGEGPATPSSSSRPPLSPLAPASAPVSGPAPIFGFAEAEGFRSASPAGASSGRGSSGGGFLSALASRLASSPGVAVPGMGTLPFAFGSGSGSRGGGGGRRGREAASLASPAHALAARAASGAESAESADSPPWRFRGLTVPSGSPGATTPWRVDRTPSNFGASVSRRASWSSPSSSLSGRGSFQEFSGAFAIRGPGGPFAYGTSPRCAALGSSPESVPGDAAGHRGIPRAVPGDAARAAVPGDDPLGPRRLVAAFAAESADDALPFELDVEEDGFAARDGAGGAVATFRETSESDPEAAVAALVRALRDAPPLGLEPGSGGAPSSAASATMTLAGAKRRLAAMRREAAVARRHRGGASSGTSSSSRASSDAEKREAPPRLSIPGSAPAPAPAPRTSDGEKKSNPEAEASRADEAKSLRTAASIAIDAAVDEALAFAAPANGS